MPPLLRDVLGKDMRLAQVFSPGLMAACQQVIDEEAAQFYARCIRQIEEAEQALDAEQGKISEVIFGLIANGGGMAHMLGFVLFARVCEVMGEVAGAPHIGLIRQRALIRLMLHMLRRICAEGIRDMEGDVAQACLATLDDYLKAMKG